MHSTWRAGYIKIGRGQRVLSVISRGPGFFPVVWFGSYPIQPTLPGQQRHTGRLRKRDNLLTGEGRGGGGGAKSHDGENAWSSINHSILSGRGGLVGILLGNGGGGGLSVITWFGPVDKILGEERDQANPKCWFFFFSAFFTMVCI